MKKLNKYITNLNKNKTLITNMSISVWFLFVVSSWYINHNDILHWLYDILNHPALPLNRLLPLSITAITILVPYIYIRLKYHTTKITLSYSWALLVLYTMIYSIILFNIIIYFRITPPLQVPIFELTFQNFFNHNLSLIKIMLTSIAWMSVFSLILYLLGKTCKKIVPLPSQNVPIIFKNLIYFSLGLFILMLITFFLAFFESLNPFYYIILFVGLLLLKRKEVFNIYKIAIQKRSLLINYHSLHSILLFFIVFIVSITFIDILRPAPFGFDATTFYFNNVKLIAENTSLIPSGRPFPFELLASIGFLFSHNAFLAIGSSFIYAFLGFFSLYGFTQYILKNNTIALITATTWLALPLTLIFVYKEPKPDLLLFFLCTMSLWSFYIWSKNHNNNLLFLTALLIGFAFTVKILALFILITIGVLIIFHWSKWPISFKEKIKSVLLMILLFMIPLIPWGLYAIHTHENQKINSISKILFSYNKNIPDLTKEVYASLGVDSSICEETSHKEDYGRFKVNTFSFPLNIFMAPWSLTMNTNKGIGSLGLNIGFIFLSILPIGILSLFRKKIIKKSLQNSFISFTIIGSLVYWILWFTFAKGVLWYGFAGFTFLYLGLAYTLYLLKNNRLIYNIISVIIILNLLMLLVMRAPLFVHRPVISFITLQIDSRSMRYKKITNILNTDEHKDALILSTASQSIYYIERNDHRVIKDWYLDKYNCLQQGGNAETILTRLQSLHIQFIIFSKGIVSIESDTNGTLHKKANTFFHFAKKHLPIEVETGEYILFSIPSNKSSK